MKTLSTIALLLAFVVVAPLVQARSTVPVIERENVSVTTGSGKPVNNEALKRAIIDGGAAGARKWEVVPAADGRSLRGTYKVRNHTVVVDIFPGPASYSVKYADSINMKYGVENGSPTIHPFYNKWVDELIESIRVELKKF
jgi:hypothetical protein